MPRCSDTGPFHTSTTIEIPRINGWFAIHINITFGVEPHDPGDWETPPCGGGIIDVDLEIAKTVNIDDNGNETVVALSPERIGHLKSYISLAFKATIDRAIEYALEHMEPEDDGDAAYDRWKDEQAERRRQ